MVTLLRCSIVLAAFFGFLSAEILSYDELKTKPKSIAKDYYIHRLIESGNYQKSQIKSLKADIYRNKGKLQAVINKIIPPYKKPDNCKGVTSANILDANLTCQRARSYPNFVKNLTPSTRAAMAENLSKFHDSVNLLLGYNEPNPAEFFVKTDNAKNFFLYYDSLSDKERSLKLNFPLNAEFLYSLKDSRQFYGFIHSIVIEGKFPNLKTSLLNLENFALEDKAAFLLGVNAITLNRRDTALNFFTKATNSAKSRHDADNAKHWIYLLSGDEKVLKELASSPNLNLYSLYAKEMLEDTKISVVVPEPKISKPKNYDTKDPFSWVKTKAKIDNADRAELENLAQFFNTKSTIGEYIYAMNKLSGYKDNFYPLAYFELLEGVNNQRKALIYAIMRQESRFIPTAISTSYALGLMQFMPFLANDIGKKQLKLANFDQDFMFEPQTALKFANIHLDWLEERVSSPLFIAYAYNGGIGFTKRMLERGDLFNRGEFEPFLSMELVPFSESRDYGKKVLANYIIYANMIDKNLGVSVKEELERLLIPARSDSFR